MTTIAQLAAVPLPTLQRLFGPNVGISFHERALGIDRRAFFEADEGDDDAPGGTSAGIHSLVPDSSSSSLLPSALFPTPQSGALSSTAAASSNQTRFTFRRPPPTVSAGITWGVRLTSMEEVRNFLRHLTRVCIYSSSPIYFSSPCLIPRSVCSSGFRLQETIKRLKNRCGYFEEPPAVNAIPANPDRSLLTADFTPPPTITPSMPQPCIGAITLSLLQTTNTQYTPDPTALASISSRPLSLWAPTMKYLGHGEVTTINRQKNVGTVTVFDEDLIVAVVVELYTLLRVQPLHLRGASVQFSKLSISIVCLLPSQKFLFSSLLFHLQPPQKLQTFKSTPTHTDDQPPSSAPSVSIAHPPKTSNANTVHSHPSKSKKQSISELIKKGKKKKNHTEQDEPPKESHDLSPKAHQSIYETEALSDIKNGLFALIQFVLSPTFVRH